MSCPGGHYTQIGYHARTIPWQTSLFIIFRLTDSLVSQMNAFWEPNVLLRFLEQQPFDWSAAHKNGAAAAAECEPRVSRIPSSDSYN